MTGMGKPFGFFRARSKPSLNGSVKQTSKTTSVTSSASEVPPSSPAVPPGATIYDVVLPGTHDSAAYTARADLTSRTTAAPLRWKPLGSLFSGVAAEFALTQSLSIIEQLRAGARFLDIRVTKRPAQSRDPSFWTHHGMVLCVPLSVLLEDVNSFHDDMEKAGKSAPIVMVFRDTALDELERKELATFVRQQLRHSIFNGTARDLRDIPWPQLPSNILAGLEGDSLDVAWGRDPWLDTYDANEKIAFLSKTLTSNAVRSQRDSLLVLGWTITPAFSDIVLRVISFGRVRSTLLAEAVRFNELIDSFLAENKPVLSSTANVIFFDAFSAILGNKVNSLNTEDMNDLK